MWDEELLRSSLQKIGTAINRILERSDTIQSPDDFLTTPSGVERIDKITDKQLLSQYPEIDWKGVMGMRDIIAHHYFDIDADIIFDVMKNNLPTVRLAVNRMIENL